MYGCLGSATSCLNRPDARYEVGNGRQDGLLYLSSMLLVMPFSQRLTPLRLHRRLIHRGGSLHIR